MLWPSRRSRDLDGAFGVAECTAPGQCGSAVARSSPHDRSQTGTEKARVRNVYTEYCKQHVHILSTNLVAAKWGDKPASVFLTGDFNARHSDWCPSDSTSPTGQKLHEIFHCFGLSQMVCFPTHVPNTQRHGSCLDLIITNSPESICDIEPSAPLGLSDHLQILCSLRFPLLSTNSLRNNTPSQYLQWNPSRPIRYNFNFRKATPQTWDRINEHIQSYDWSPLSVMPDVDVALAYFEHTLQYLFDLYLPHHAPTHRPTSPSSDPPWMTPALRSAVKRKHDAFSVSRKYPTADNLAAYRRQRNLVKDLSRHDYRSYIRSIKSTLSSNDHPSLSQFVRRLRKPTSTSAPITSMQRPDGSIAHDTRDIANLLNVHFTTVAPSDDPRWCVPSLAEHSAILSSLDSFQTSPSTVRTVINKLKINKSPGFDGLPNEVLKRLAPSISSPLSTIFNISFASGVYPLVWKFAVVTPIYKNKGSRQHTTNYRPISLLPSLSKVCERVVYNILYTHFSPALSRNISAKAKRLHIHVHVLNLRTACCFVLFELISAAQRK